MHLARLNRMEESDNKMNKIDDICNSFSNNEIQLHTKIANLLSLPHILKINELTSEKCEHIFNSLPLDVIKCILNSTAPEIDEAKPIAIEIISFCCQSTKSDVFLKFNPVLPDIMTFLSSQKEYSQALLNEISVILTFLPYKNSDLKYLFESLRYISSHYINQERNLDVSSFLSILRIIFSKIFALVRVGDEENVIDERGWSVRILSILRNLIKEKSEKVERDIREATWDIIGAISRLLGSKWLCLDEKLAELVSNLNSVEIQMVLYNASEVDPVVFARHLRILEVFITSIQDDENFVKTKYLDGVVSSIGASIKYIIEFWTNVLRSEENVNRKVRFHMFSFVVFLLSRGELDIIDESIRKEMGVLIIKEAEFIIDSTNENEMQTELCPLMIELLENIDEFSTLSDRLPVVIAKFLKFLCSSIPEGEWQLVAFEINATLKNIKKRIDWYGKSTLHESTTIFKSFEKTRMEYVDEIIEFFKEKETQ